MVNWPSMNIPKDVFKDIEAEIVSDSQGINDVKNLQITEGTKYYKGRKAVVKYNYNTKNGGIRLNERTVNPSTWQYLLKHTSLNETEERIWIVNDNVKFINISGCILGYIEPKGDDAVEQFINDGYLPELPVSKY